jgi:hypothetical protein
MQILDAELEAGSHRIALPAEVPLVASFVVVTCGSAVRTRTVGAMPQSVMGMVPPVSEVNTRSHDG